jgi:protein O-mannosyl-transferase
VPWAFRLVNILLHALSVQLAYRTLGRWLGPDAGFAAAAIFAVHPLQAHTVLYVFARPTLMMAIFLWLALDAWRERRDLRCGVFFLLALLGKEEAVAFPLILLLVRRDWKPLAAMSALAVAFVAATIALTARIAGSGAGAQAGVSPLTYLATQPMALLEYAKHALVPVLRAPFVTNLPWQPAAVALGWLVPLAGAWALRKRSWAPLAVLALLAPTSTIFPLQEALAFRRMYLPLVCLATLIPVRWATPAAMALALLAGLDAWQRWRDPVALWQQARVSNPGYALPVLQEAKYLDAQAAAKLLAENSFPDNADYQTERGRVALEMRQPVEALRAFGKALALDPERPVRIYNRGVALLALGQREAAKADFERALSRDPKLKLAAEALETLKASPPVR